MKTLIATVLFAALTITSANFAQADVAGALKDAGQSSKTIVKKVTTEQLGEMLDNMGYSPRANKNKDGKVLGYYIDLKRGDTKINVYINVSTSGTNLWLDVDLLTFNEKNPATTEVLLAFLATQDRLWPAYVVYYPKSQNMQLAMSMDTAGFGPSTMRTNLDSIMDKFLIVSEAYKKVKADEPKAGGVVKD